MLENVAITNKRNAWLDLIKLIASFMVVFIHIDFPGRFGIVVDAIARFAVPLFFAVSGFFSLNASAKTIKRRLKKIVVIYLIATAIYHVYNAINVGFIEYITSTFTLRNLLAFIFLNVPFSSSHLWFLLALIYVYLIWLLILKFSFSNKRIFILSVALLLIHLILGEVLTIFNVRVPILIVRNFIYMGFPFFVFGYFANKYKEKLAKTNNLVLVLIMALGCIESALIYLFFDYLEIYVGSLLCLYALFVIAIKCEQKPLGRFWTLISQTSTDVYILHILVSSLGKALVGALKIPTENWVFGYAWPIIVCLICVALSLIKNAVIVKIKSKNIKTA